MSEVRDLLKKVIEANGLFADLKEEIEAYLSNPVPEPVAWISYGMYTAVQNGRAWENLCATKHKCSTDDVAVYLHAEPSERKPLSENEIRKIIIENAKPIHFARAIEKAHGIE